MTRDVGTCSSCGSELPPDAPNGSCPRCLYKLAFGGPVEAAPSDPWSSLPDECLQNGTQGMPAVRSFGDYELLERIGHGGMGVVYKARQKSLNRIVALKLLPLGAHAPPESVKRFRAEAVSTAALQHPNIVAIHEVGICDGQHFIAMDYVEGRPLSELIRGTPLPPRRAAACVKTLAEAVHCAHERGILHRDLKPANVLIDANDQPRVTDFGLAKKLADSQLSTPDSQLTLTGQVLGSPNYIPPEQAAGGRGTLSRRTDVYALGAVLYHALTGRPPYLGDGLADIVQQVLNREPISPRALNPGVPVDLETVCLKCLEKEPGKRYPTAQALADELQRFLNGQPVLARPVGPAGKTWRWCRRNPHMAILAAVAFVLFAAGSVGVFWQWRRAAAGESLARQRLYASDINLAEQALTANNPGRALELLERHRPHAVGELRAMDAESDWRGFEWRYLWQQCQNEAEAVGQLPSGIRSLEVSRDGRWLLGTSGQGAVKVWDRSTGEALAVAAEGGTKGNATFSPDSRLLFFTDQARDSRGTIGILDLQTRGRLTPITNEWWVGPMFFSPDGQRFSYGLCSPAFQRKFVSLQYPDWKNLGEGVLRTPFTGGDHHGYSWVFTHDGRSILFSENDPDRRIAILEIGAGTKPQFFEGHREAITAMAISPDGQVLATAAGFTETDIKLWEVPAIRPLGELRGHESYVVGLAFSPDGATLASAGTDQTVRLWDVAARGMNWVSPRLPQEVWRVCFSPDGRTLFSGCQDGEIHQWPLPPPQAKARDWRISATFSSLSVAPSGVGFAGIRKGAVYLADTVGSAPPAQVPELGTNNTCVHFSADGEFLYAGTRAGEVREWSIPRHQLLRSRRYSTEPIRALRCDAAGQILVVVQTSLGKIQPGFPCRIGVWNGADWSERQSWMVAGLGPVCALSPTGQWLALGDRFGPVRVWNLSHRGGAEPAILAAGTTTGLAFSRGSSLLAVSNEEGFVHVWKLPAFRKLAPFRAHRREVRAITFSPDGRRLATAGEGDEALKLWLAPTRQESAWQELMTLELPGDSLNHLAFSSDGNQLTARNGQGDVLAWRAPSFEEIERSGRRTGPVVLHSERPGQ